MGAYRYTFTPSHMTTASITEVQCQAKQRVAPEQAPPAGTIRSLTLRTADNAVALIFGVLIAWTSLSAYGVYRRPSADGLKLLYEALIPFGAGLALFTAYTMAVIQGVRQMQALKLPEASEFGRKGILISTASVILVLSCLYRSVFVASEGAALCRGSPSVFNAPVAGRSVATFGEIAFAVQVGTYIADTAKRLGVRGRVWTSSLLLVWGSVCLAEALSWSGVVSGNARFFCIEYFTWCAIATAWAWDSAELLGKSRRWGDILTHCTILFMSLGLFSFNAFMEIPHFYLNYQRAVAGVADDTVGGTSMWECLQDPDGPIWIKRLPFFFCYFFGCSWSSVALSYRYLLRGQTSTKLKPKAV